MAFDNSEESESGSISQINVTPLVDVMLVLLVIFMVAAPILQQGVEVELPQETIDAIEGDGEQLVVTVDKDGSVYIGSKTKIKIDGLSEKIKAIVSLREDKRVFIRADQRANYGAVMAVVSRIKNAGIDKVGLIAEPA